MSGLPHTLMKSQAEGGGEQPLTCRGGREIGTAKSSIPLVAPRGGIAVFGVLWAFRRRRSIFKFFPDFSVVENIGNTKKCQAES